MRRPAFLTLLIGGKMARREVVEVVCDRCKRTDNQTKDSLPKTDGSAEVVITLHGKTTTFHDLCRSCRKAIANYHEGMVNYRRKANKDGEPKVKDVDVPEPGAKASLGGIFSRKAAG